MQNMQLPEDFIRETRQLMGSERYSRYMEAFDEEAPVSIRLNPKNISQRDGSFVTLAISQKNRPSVIPWCPEGYYLEGRPQFTFDPLFHAGCYYVQEASSMFITHILRTILSALTAHLSPLNVLDLCAAPGGKSTAMLSVLPEGSTLVSNEPIPTRAQILLENITKWGAENCIVTNNYPRDFRKAKAKFDLILCDVPCSGEGMFRKDPATIGEWSLQNVEKCWRLQREIVSDAWECLNPGGILIYSTCTFNTKENEENVRWIMEEYDAEPITIPTEPSWGITGSLLEGFDAPIYRFIPGITKGEGLFVCVLRKRGEWREEREERKEESGKRKENTLANEKLDKNKFIKILDLGNLFPLSTFPFPQQTINLSYPEALKYLRGEALVLSPDTPRGIVTVSYKGFPLGPVKNIGNRANNLYPKPWRIKTTHLPTEPPGIIRLPNC
jgi:16S rRNA C967 or C1407 C5-methylase (RsmB/RsmF family)